MLSRSRGGVHNQNEDIELEEDIIPEKVDIVKILLHPDNAD